jgi:predicted nucleic acid-binding protein
MNRFVSHSMALWTNSPTDVFEAPYTSADRLADIGTLVEPSGRLSVFRDAPDNRILECAVEGTADAIVTGDKAMLAIGGYEGIRLITLADYLDKLGRSR